MTDSRETNTRFFPPPRGMFIFLLLLLVVACDGRSWDIAVAIGREIHFFSRNQSFTGQVKIADAVSISAMAYDEKTHTMYLGDRKANSSIFSTDLSERNVTTKPLLEKEGKTFISGMVFDSRSRTLFWADNAKQVIMKVHVPLSGPPEEPVLLHQLTESPSDIVLDLCNSHVYWSCSSSWRSVIERSNFDGSDRTMIVNSSLYEPVGLAVDHADGKLYWIDDDEGIHFRIERSDLDGSQREVLLRSRHQQPVDLAVDDEAIYWSDWVHPAVWTMSKSGNDGNSAVKFKPYQRSNVEADPAAIIARNNIDCAALKSKLEAKQKIQTLKITQTNSLIESYNNLTTSTELEDPESSTEKLIFCLNGGIFDKTIKSCRCSPGHTGTVCEISLCHNYCLRGDCTINQEGLPTCKCPASFTGERCEKNPCEDYCLNEGECTVHNSKATCKCTSAFKGTRCENFTGLDEICAMFCANDLPKVVNVDVASCRCESSNQTTKNMTSFFNEKFEYTTLLAIFTALIVVLVILVIVLSFYVNRLRRRPRIKKRFVVSKGGVTPLTSRPQIPDNQCEITIENCCNMNICETPCFEPKVRTPTAKNSYAKKEEKSFLLDNMDSGNSC